MSSPRLVAWSLLRSGSPTPLREVDSDAAAAALDDRDRAFVRRLVGTEIRRRGTLRALVRAFAHGKPDADLVAHLHLGLAQAFFFDRVPDHALVSETVGAVHATLGRTKAHYANAVLRTALRARRDGTSGDRRSDIPLRELHLAVQVFHDPRVHPLLWAEDALSMPAAVMKRWSARFGEETAQALALCALEEPPVSLRVVRGERAALAAELLELGLHPREGEHERILLLPAPESEAATSSAAFREGRATIQGATALRAAEALQARAGESLLDLCSAPGGKTAVLAESGASVTACDVTPAKLARVRSGIERLRPAGEVRLLNVADERQRAAMESELYDGVLVDAPCTNTGVLAQRPEARWRYGPATKRELLDLQAGLLAQGAARVRSGGRLVWSTCSLDRDENARLASRFVAGNAGWSLEEERESLPDPQSASEHGRGPIDGGYFARLRRGG